MHGQLQKSQDSRNRTALPCARGIKLHTNGISTFKRTNLLEHGVALNPSKSNPEAFFWKRVKLPNDGLQRVQWRQHLIITHHHYFLIWRARTWRLARPVSKLGECGATKVMEGFD